MRVLSKTVGLGILVSCLLASALAADTRLAEAARLGDKAAVAALIKQGVNVNEAFGDGTTPLHWAAGNGDLDITQQLLKAGANANAGTRIGSVTPLFMAAKQGHALVVDALLKAGADLKLANGNGTTVLM